MKEFNVITTEIVRWSVYSEEKHLDFNSTLITAPGGCVLIDPVAVTPSQLESIRAKNPLSILITNKDHKRAAPELRERLGIPVWIHEQEAALYDGKVDHVFKETDRLPLGIVPLHLKKLKTPGECAFFWGREGGTVVVGDAVIGKPKAGLTLLPLEKIPDPIGALRSLDRLAEWRFERLLVGDGESVLKKGREEFLNFLNSKPH